MPNASVLSVRQLNFYVKTLLEGDIRLISCSVMGEISNFKRHFSSGHCYFTLKDDFSAIKCVMFKSAAIRVPFDMKDGMKVVLRGRVSLYEKDGTYQFYAENAEPEGIGSKALALKQLKEKLLKEGLFDSSNKRNLKEFPQKIAVVTSGSGAALHDVINVISRRYPVCEIIVASVSVQGEKAAAEIVSMLSKIYKIDGIDTVILGRGGGSSEDLDAFNSEILVRKVFESPFPVISAVGHETDVTLCDLVADMRAPTPSAAAELAVPDIISLNGYINSNLKRITSLLNTKLNLAELRLNAVRNLSVVKKPGLLAESRELQLDKLTQNINSSFLSVFNYNEKRFAEVLSKVESLSPLSCLARGYSVIYKNGKTVKKAEDTEIDDILNIRMSVGKIKCKVINKE